MLLGSDAEPSAMQQDPCPRFTWKQKFPDQQMTGSEVTQLASSPGLSGCSLLPAAELPGPCVSLAGRGPSRTDVKMGRHKVREGTRERCSNSQGKGLRRKMAKQMPHAWQNISLQGHFLILYCRSWLLQLHSYWLKVHFGLILTGKKKTSLKLINDVDFVNLSQIHMLLTQKCNASLLGCPSLT